AVFNPFLYFLMENYGLMYTSPAIAAVIIGTIPVFAPITGYLAFKEKLRWYNIAGILLSFTGVVMMLITPDFKISVNPAGLLFLAGAVMASLIYAVGLKKLTARYSSVTIISWQNLTGIFLFLPFFLIFEMKDAIRVPLNATIITSFLFLSILASSLSYVFYVKAIKNLGIGKASIFTNLIPVFTAIASFFLLGELFTFQKIAGILIVIFGVVISQISSREK
ncbi:MAG TPA: DMT family transporter, partial [Paludibacteraceae bacterium]|nr:DMT family transporter [Paludibacteraceae bacterium]